MVINRERRLRVSVVDRIKIVTRNVTGIIIITFYTALMIRERVDVDWSLLDDKMTNMNWLECDIRIRPPSHSFLCIAHRRISAVLLQGWINGIDIERSHHRYNITVYTDNYCYETHLGTISSHWWNINKIFFSNQVFGVEWKSSPMSTFTVLCFADTNGILEHFHTIIIESEIYLHSVDCKYIFGKITTHYGINSRVWRFYVASILVAVRKLFKFGYLIVVITFVYIVLILWHECQSAIMIQISTRVIFYLSA